ncbi:sensor histidine kinase [Carboxylicivirga caseinilyticus]|uniref:sensor histidine kinase n=1 Tax=Carboxylicivirga caseinilyticus TaxID=3417572 RepID=UPI003D34B189|nr:histidine kinase [Marinilabiliaceae bacterium A049]
MKKLLDRNSWFIYLFVSIPLAILIILAIPIKFDQYNVQVSNLNKKDNRDHGRVMYHDFNNDGVSERIVAHTDNLSKSACFQMHDYNSNLLGQINLKGNLNDNFNNFALGPIFDNDFDDIALLTIKQDSIFLNYCDITINKKHGNIEGQPQFIFIDQIRKNKFGAYDFTYNIKLHDSNNDGKLEIYIAIFSGYSIQPRKLYMYDVHNKELLKSNTDGSCGNNHIWFTDLDRDGIDELIGVCYAPWNISDTTRYKYHDQNSYCMVFNNDLTFHFDPIINHGGYTSFNFQTIENNKNNIFALLKTSASDKREPQSLKLYNHKGEVVRQTNLPKQDRNNSIAILPEFKDSIIWLLNPKSSNITILNIQFDTIKTIDIPVEGFGLKHLSLTDQKQSILFTNLANGIVNIWFEQKTFIPINNIPPCTPKAIEISLIKHPSLKIPKICIFEDGYEHIITINKNPYFIYRFPYYLTIAIVAFFLVYWVLNDQKKRIIKRFEEKERLRELELASTYNQLDPHFTFNVLNAIGGSIMMGKKEEAYEYFANLSELIRLTLIKAKDSARTLKEEIDFVRKYLEIERFRFGSKLDYSIDLDESIDIEIEIPKMLIQIFVENALKHGITPKDGNGQISISIINKNQTIKVTIEDNGIGRAAAKSYNIKSTGKGLQVMKEYINLFNDQNKRKINFNITDKYDTEGVAIGTKVEITF